jgi:TolA-binding protein
MSSNNRNINMRSSGDNEWDDSALSAEDHALLQKIGSCLKGELDIEEVKNDPGYEATNRTVKSMLSDYQFNTTNTKNRDFISSSLAAKKQEEKIREEIRDIKREIENKKLNDITSEWVREWHDKKQHNGKKDPRKEEMKEYISASIEEDTAVEKTEPQKTEKSGIKRRLVIRYISLAAAVITGAVIIITTLIPGSSPEKIYTRYYELIEAVSPVTRSLNDNEADVWAEAVTSYNNGDYATAAAGFSSLASVNPAPRFYLGMCHMGMSEYDEAVKILRGVVGEHGEFAREAEWYLGLAYLKLGNIEAASACFESLVQSQGYYSERSEEILRRLK